MNTECDYSRINRNNQLCSACLKELSFLLHLTCWVQFPLLLTADEVHVNSAFPVSLTSLPVSHCLHYAERNALKLL